MGSYCQVVELLPFLDLGLAGFEGFGDGLLVAALNGTRKGILFGRRLDPAKHRTTGGDSFAADYAARELSAFEKRC